MPTYRILVPTDFSPSSEIALRQAIELAASRMPAEVVLLYVDTGLMLSPTEDLGILEPTRLMAAMKMRAAERAVASDVPVDELMTEGDPAQIIIQTVKDRQIDMIVMGTHGRTGVDRILMGSVAESVLRKSDCPVLFVKNRP